MAQIVAALDWATAPSAQPAMILARTVKGKGVSFMENVPDYHNAAITPAQIEQALADLQAHLAELAEA